MMMMIIMMMIDEEYTNLCNLCFLLLSIHIFLTSHLFPYLSLFPSLQFPCRKLESNRMIARERWKRAWTKVRATLRFKGKLKGVRERLRGQHTQEEKDGTSPPLPIERADSIVSNSKEEEEYKE